MNHIYRLKRSNILGVGISAIDIELAIRTLDKWIHTAESHYICVTGVHGVIESQKDESLRKIHNTAGLVMADGMPLVWMSRLKGYRDIKRGYGPDLMLKICEYGIAHGYSHFFYGGSEGVPEMLADNLRQRFPDLQVVGRFSPPFRPLTEAEDVQVVEMINEADPDIVWVGLSTPKQERWMAAHIDRLHAPVLLGVGAAFDFHAGLKPQAPRWMQRSGLEWLFRLLTEPKRLWKRYLINNPLFIILIILQCLGLKKYPLDN